MLRGATETRPRRRTQKQDEGGGPGSRWGRRTAPRHTPTELQSCPHRTHGKGRGAVNLTIRSEGRPHAQSFYHEFLRQAGSGLAAGPRAKCAKNVTTQRRGAGGPGAHCAREGDLLFPGPLRFLTVVPLGPIREASGLARLKPVASGFRARPSTLGAGPQGTYQLPSLLGDGADVHRVALHHV